MELQDSSGTTRVLKYPRGSQRNPHTHAFHRKENYSVICLLHPLTQPPANVAFLCISMKLVTWLPWNNDNDPLRKATLSVKQCASGDCWYFILQVLQAYILISLYELGHGVYLSAYMAISAL